jgi:hypothetical protein
MKYNPMLLAGDIGGTKTDLAIFSNEAGPLAPLVQAEVHSADYPSLQALARDPSAVIFTSAVYKKTSKLHLRQLFAEDPERGESPFTSITSSPRASYVIGNQRRRIYERRNYQPARQPGERARFAQDRQR